MLKLCNRNEGNGIHRSQATENISYGAINNVYAMTSITAVQLAKQNVWRNMLIAKLIFTCKSHSDHWLFSGFPGILWNYILRVLDFCSASRYHTSTVLNAKKLVYAIYLYNFLFFSFMRTKVIMYVELETILSNLHYVCLEINIHIEENQFSVFVSIKVINLWGE